MNADELYERHQVLSALGNVLLHDLRNPLHSATLLIEAMGLKTSDLDTMRARLRAQLAKLDALISDAAGPMRELALEPRIEVVALSDLLAKTRELARARNDEFDLDEETAGLGPVRVSCDVALMSRAMVEVIERVRSEIAASTPGVRPRVALRADCPEGDTAHVSIAGATSPFPEVMAKAPFAIGGGGVGVALARALAQLSNASLRLQGGNTAAPAFVFLLAREGAA